MGIKMNPLEKNKNKIPDEFKDLAKDFAEKGFITTSSENLINWARTGSLHWMTFGLACCAVEMMQTSMPRYDLERFGAAPNLSRSYLGIEVCIISTAQQAKPKVIQCNEPVRAQLTKFSLEVVIKPFSAKSFARSLNSSGIFSCLLEKESSFIPIPKLLFSIHK